MDSIFTKIVKNKIPSYKIAEDSDFLAFLDINPNTKGHTLCIPKKQIDNFLDLDEKTYNGLMAFSKKIALAIQKAIPCQRVGLSIVGLDVPHVHVHLIPIHSILDMGFQKKTTMNTSDFIKTSDAIRKFLPN